MNPHTDRARETFHFAKLSLFNVRLCEDIERLRDQVSALDELVGRRAAADRVKMPVGLLHQATFLSHAYICLVWLWEAVKENGSAADALLRGIDDRFSFAGVPRSGPRPLLMTKDYVILIRNAISHGRVMVDDDNFSFEDQRTRGKYPESEPTRVTLTWKQLACLSDAALFAANDFLYGRAV